jgi:hypothetical protein
MRARAGDRIVLASPTVDGPVRDGEVLESRGDDGAPPYLVRWSDGHEGLLYPGPGSVLRVTSHDRDGSGTSVPSQPVTPPATHAPKVHDWQVRVSIFESDDDTEATVVLLADSPDHLTARGRSHRSDHDRVVPEIGDEVAVARALRSLADQLLATAAGDIEGVTGEHDVHLRER